MFGPAKLPGPLRWPNCVQGEEVRCLSDESALLAAGRPESDRRCSKIRAPLKRFGVAVAWQPGGSTRKPERCVRQRCNPAQSVANRCKWKRGRALKQPKPTCCAFPWNVRARPLAIPDTCGNGHRLTPENVKVDQGERRWRCRRESRRAKWREFLGRVLADRSEAADTSQNELESTGGSVAVADAASTLNGLKVQNHYIILDLDAFDTFVSLLLLDEEFGGELCQCQLKNCGRFFLEKKPPPGAPSGCIAAVSVCWRRMQASRRAVRASHGLPRRGNRSESRSICPIFHRQTARCLHR